MLNESRVHWLFENKKKKNFFLSTFRVDCDHNFVVRVIATKAFTNVVDTVDARQCGKSIGTIQRVTFGKFCCASMRKMDIFSLFALESIFTFHIKVHAEIEMNTCMKTADRSLHLPVSTLFEELKCVQ